VYLFERWTAEEAETGRSLYSNAVISIFIMLFYEQTSKSYSSAALLTSGQLDKLTELTAGACTEADKLKVRSLCNVCFGQAILKPFLGCLFDIE